MPRYFFHVFNGKNSLDRDGVEFPNAAEAREAAVCASAEALRDYAAEFWNHPEWRMEVKDEAGQTVCTVKCLGE